MLRLQRALRIRPGEGPTVIRVLGLHLLVWGGFAIGGTAVESLLFARTGPSVLPYLYMGLGALTLVAMLGVSEVLRRLPPPRVLAWLPVGMAAVVLASRAAVELGRGWVYPALWLAMMILGTVQGTATWGLASTVHDTRQAKRLFPLYGAGLIVGGAVGGLLTRPLAAAIGAENLLVVWGAALAGAWLVARSTLRGRASMVRRRRGEPTGFLAEMGSGVRFVMSSPLLRSMAGALTLFALLYFALTLPFARAATDRYPDADRLAGFLGTFFGLVNGTALLVSLTLTNRLFARFGVAPMVAVLPAIYLVGFLALAARPAFLALVAFRFLQLVWVNGVWASGWQALFNVVPPERRNQIRTFMDGGPLQVGIVLSGLLLIVGERSIGPRTVFLGAAALGALGLVLTWRATRAYGRALTDALRAGWPEVFVSEEEPFGGVRRDGAAVAVLLDASRDPDPRARRIAVEILGEVGSEESWEAVGRALADPDRDVRRAAVEAMARHPDPAAGPEVDALLEEADPAVRARAATVLHRAGDPRGLEVLTGMARSAEPEWRAEVLGALAAAGSAGAGVLDAALSDPVPEVRRAGVQAIRDGPGAVEALLGALGDADASVRAAAVEALVTVGASAVEPLLRTLVDPALEEGAVLALQRLPAVDPQALREYARAQVALARRYHDQWWEVRADADERLSLVADAVRHRALDHGLNAMRAIAPISDPGAIDLAIEGLRSRDAEQRANALETLEATVEPDLVRPLLAVWEGTGRPAGDGVGALLRILGDEDPWLRACAAFAAGTFDDARLRSEVEGLAEADPDTVVREAAARTLRGDADIETLPTISLMDRILALRRVPLFRDLSPVDIKHVAESTTEHLYPGGAVIAEQGEPGDAMHVVVSGDVRVLLAQDEREAVEVARRATGYIVGEMAILSEEPRMASLVADGEVRTLSIDRRRFQRILRERPDAALAVMRELCFRLQEAHAAGPADPGPAPR